MEPPTQAEEGTKPRPVQILNFEFYQSPENQRRSKLILSTENLGGILKKGGDRPVALISIVGPSRQGKSFLLGFLLRYLESLKTEETDWFGHDSPDKGLEGFKWRNGVDPETQGTWMWSEPFFIKLGTGQEICVLLMDTQGTYDEFTSQREWSSIVGLSLLTSSCLIFNFFNNLQEDTLSSLGSFIDYGLMATGTGDEKSFQKLMFLIRDWNTPAQFPYGSKGGSSFLDYKLSIKAEHGEEAKRIRTSIRACFEELSCFLMPEPGEKLKSKDYDGSIRGLNPKFTKNLEIFVTDLLNPDELKVKHTGGTITKMSELGLFFEKYVQVLNSEEILQPLSIHEATMSVVNTNVVAEAFDAYKKGMQATLRKQKFYSDKGIGASHAKLAEKSLQQFSTVWKIGPAEVIEEYRQQLEEKLEREFDEVRKKNSDKKYKILQEATAAAKDKYLKSMNEELGEGFLDSKIFKNTSEVYKDEVLAVFADECSSEDPELLPGIVAKCTETLEHEEEALMTTNAKRLQDAENSIRDVITQALELYSAGMKNGIGESGYVTTEELEALNQSSTAAAQAFYAGAKSGDPSFLKKYDAELSKFLESHYATLENENATRKETLELRCSEFVTLKIKDYEVQMKIILATVNSPEELKEEHETCSAEILSLFQAAEEFPDEIRKSRLPFLQEQIAEAFASFQAEYSKNSRNLEMECEQACTAGLSLFQVEMSSLLGSKEYHRTHDFEAETQKLREDVIDEVYDDIQQLNVGAEDESRHLLKLKADLDLAIVKFKEQNVVKQEHAAAKAQNDASDAVRKYQADLKGGMANCRTESDLLALHSKFKGSTIDSFEAKYVNVHAEFLEPHTTELGAEIERIYVDLQEIFELKREESEAGTKAALGDAQKFYREEMEKHFKNDSDFMSPADLIALHKMVTTRTIERCNQKLGSTLSTVQKEDLGAALEKVYLQYKDTNRMNMPVDPAIGIDLGTTFCCVAVYHRGKVSIIDNNGAKTTPSYVAFQDSGEVVGEAAKNEAHEHPEDTIYDAKRIIGRKFTDPKLQGDMDGWPFTVVEDKGIPKVEARGKTYHPEEISAKLLEQMKKAAQDHLGGVKVTNAVITVPAYFNDGQRQATVDAGELAGLKVLQILDEPTAAAIAYRLQHVDLDARNVLIFDLGGGTFDVAVLRILGGVIDVKTKDGDTHLGGEDFDKALVDHCVLEFQSQHGIKLTEGKDSTSELERHEVYRSLRRLKSQCEDRKVDLSSSKSVRIAVDAIRNGLDLSVDVTRQQFEDMNATCFAKTIEIVERALKSAGMGKNEIHDIVLVGGSTRIPKIQQLLTDFFGGKALNKTINPDEAVAYGAAIQAAILHGEIAQGSIDFTKVMDVTPMSLGVEVYSGDLSTIIRKNTNIPVRLTETYKTAHNNQTSVQIMVYQGEHRLAKDNEKLGDFVMNGIPPGAAGVENIEVCMEINQQGILHVTATCCSTGGKKDLAITEYKQRLSRSQIEKILAGNGQTA